MHGNKVSDLTIDELRSIIRETVRQTLAEMLVDPDDGLVLQAGIEKTLTYSIKAVKEGGQKIGAGVVNVPGQFYAQSVGVDGDIEQVCRPTSA